MASTLRILCTGDLHVGRRPSRVAQWMDPGRASCARMLGEIVELALRERVDIVAISGDLVDKENKYHEAYGPVERGLKKLAAAGIDVFAVAGNHDFDVLPRLADAVGAERFHLLGRGGNWERKSFVRNGTAALHIVGWSFPAEHVPDNPMQTFGALPPLERADHSPVLGLLHADLDQPDSRYAPVALRDLQSVPISAWLLGHVHRPCWIAPEGKTGVLYPGSPQAMDPGETGAHGPWLIDIDRAGRVVARHLPLSLVRYDAIDIDLTGICTKEEFDAHIPLQLRQRLADSCRECGPLELCSVRIRLIGSTPLHSQLKGYCREIREQLQLTIERFSVRVEQIALDTRPPIDLADLARGSSVAADVARLLLELQGDLSLASPAQKQSDALLSRAAELTESICGARAYQPLAPADYPLPDRAAMRAALLRQGVVLLDALLEQKREPSMTGAIL